MIQDDVWVKKYQELMTFIETNHRNPSRHNPEERGLFLNCLKQNRKMLNDVKLKEEMIGKFENLLKLGKKYKRVNQFYNIRRIMLIIVCG